MLDRSAHSLRLVAATEQVPLRGTCCGCALASAALGRKVPAHPLSRFTPSACARPSPRCARRCAHAARRACPPLVAVVVPPLPPPPQTMPRGCCARPPGRKSTRARAALYFHTNQPTARAYRTNRRMRRRARRVRTFPRRGTKPRLFHRHARRCDRRYVGHNAKPCSWATLGEFVVFLRLGERVGVDVLVRRCGADPGVPLIALEAAASPLWWSLSGREKRDTANAYRGHRAQTETFPPPFSFGH